MNHKFDVCGIGNAIVDVISHVDDGFLLTQRLPKGGMQLIDQATARGLYSRMGPAVEMSGGSAANSMVGISNLGGKACFVGKVADDILGKIFRHDIKASGVDYQLDPLTQGPETARCYILVTPDGERTMNTFLGASVEFGPNDIDERTIRESKIIYLEGYLWDKPKAKESFQLAAQYAQKAGTKVALTLSDSFCVTRHRDSFLSLISTSIDVLFANEAEILSLFQTSDFDMAVGSAKKLCPLVIITRSEKGSVIITQNEQITIPAYDVKTLVDTTGAGDLYASGFLYGYSQKFQLDKCGKLGSLLASHIISQIGARPQIDLRKLAAQFDIL